MDTLQRGIITLIRSGLTGEKIRLPEEFDIEMAYPVLVKHQIHSLCYIGAVNCGVDKALPAMRRLFQNYCHCIRHSEGQLEEVERICRAFDENGVDYMPLKGCRLKYLYPKPELRIMGDADILIREKQYAYVRPIMLSLGFNETSAGIESEYDYKWDTKKLHAELHWRVVTPKNHLFFCILAMDGRALK